MPHATAQPPTGQPEQRLLVHGVSWKDYLVLREVLDTPGIRMTYCQGALELMGPSRTHELHKTTIARPVELNAFLRGLPLVGYGSTTFRNQAKERGAEPDECAGLATERTTAPRGARNEPEADWRPYPEGPSPSRGPDLCLICGGNGPH